MTGHLVAGDRRCSQCGDTLEGELAHLIHDDDCTVPVLRYCACDDERCFECCSVCQDATA